MTIKVRFLRADAPDDSAAMEVECAPGQSLMQVAVDAGVAGIDADCGGSLICATCHVYVRASDAARLPAPDEDEEAMLEFTAAPRRQNSRLSCQIRLNEALDGLTVEVP